uniref:Uncharacterized protein n=1 Tax=Anguilla anguilla TaxID=7936 RepID=A0A0E9TYR0_ANGAN
MSVCMKMNSSKDPSTPLEAIWQRYCGIVGFENLDM